jgi:hypothetical protein
MQGEWRSGYADSNGFSLCCERRGHGRGDGRSGRGRADRQ